MIWLKGHEQQQQKKNNTTNKQKKQIPTSFMDVLITK